MSVVYRFAGFTLFPDRRRLLSAGGLVRIGSRALDLLCALIERRDRVVGSQELMELVWPNLIVEPNNLQVQVFMLRRLIGAQAIATVERRGYRFVLPVERGAARPRERGSRGDEALYRESIGSAALEADSAGSPATLWPLLRDARLLTLAGIGDGPAVSLDMLIGRLLPTRHSGHVWRIDAGCFVRGAMPDARGRSRASGWRPGERSPLRGCFHQPDAVLVLHARRGPGRGLKAAVREALARTPSLRIVVVGGRALGLPGEAVVRLADLPAGVRVAPDATTTSSGHALRWRPRFSRGHDPSIRVR